VRWEEQELFPSVEGRVEEADLHQVMDELERRLVLNRMEQKAAKRS
jgi:hypothetical protein